MSKTEATPRPWAVDPSPRQWHQTTRIVAPLNVEVARVAVDGQRNDSAQTAATAALIVRAVNAHADLVAALRSIIEEFARDKADQGMCGDPHTLGRINRARAALAKAEA